MNSTTGNRLDYSHIFRAYDSIQRTRDAAAADLSRPRNALESFLHGLTSGKTSSGFHRMQRCRDALEALDRRGWQRSYHQRLFHDNFIRACARIFWKTEPPGSFARDHQKILEMNGWDHLSQEILVSTPRRSLFPHNSPLFPPFLSLFFSLHALLAHSSVILGLPPGDHALARRARGLAAPAQVHVAQTAH